MFLIEWISALKEKTYITWILITLGWIITFIIALYISNRNHRLSKTESLKQSLRDEIKNLQSISIDYWRKGEKDTDLLILSSLSRVESSLNLFRNSKKKSSSQQLYFAFKNAITGDDRFRSDDFIPDDSTKTIIENIAITANPFSDSLNDLDLS